jgi:hypothetical protein
VNDSVRGEYIKLKRVVAKMARMWNQVESEISKAKSEIKDCNSRISEINSMYYTAIARISGDPYASHNPSAARSAKAQAESSRDSAIRPYESEISSLKSKISTLESELEKIDPPRYWEYKGLCPKCGGSPDELGIQCSKCGEMFVSEEEAKIRIIAHRKKEAALARRPIGIMLHLSLTVVYLWLLFDSDIIHAPWLEWLAPAYDVERSFDFFACFLPLTIYAFTMGVVNKFTGSNLASGILLVIAVVAIQSIGVLWGNVGFFSFIWMLVVSLVINLLCAIPGFIALMATEKT